MPQGQKTSFRTCALIGMCVRSSKSAHARIITKTRRFKYIENFTIKKGIFFQIKILIFFIFLLKTEIVGTR